MPSRLAARSRRIEPAAAVIIGLAGLTACATKPSRPLERIRPGDRGAVGGRDEPRDGNMSAMSLDAAKRKLEVIHAVSGAEFTFYCGCRYEIQGVSPGSGRLRARTRIRRDACGYEPKVNSERAQRLEWEHVVPAATLGEQRPAWTDGHKDCVDDDGEPYAGRRCATKVDGLFQRMEADMHNLVPTIGEINGERSNRPMGIVRGEPRSFGRCDFEVRDGVAEPKRSLRGDVARIYLYMDAVYPSAGILDPQGRTMFDAWSKVDPPTRWECERERLIAQAQGHTNHVVRAACNERFGGPGRALDVP